MTAASHCPSQWWGQDLHSSEPEVLKWCSRENSYLTSRPAQAAAAHRHLGQAWPHTFVTLAGVQGRTLQPCPSAERVNTSLNTTSSKTQPRESQLQLLRTAGLQPPRSTAPARQVGPWWQESCSSHAEPPSWDKHRAATTQPMQEAKGLSNLSWDDWGGVKNRELLV